MPTVIDAYLASNYVVMTASGEVTLQIGIANSQFAAVLDQVAAQSGKQAATAVIITAWNPRSIPQDSATNALMQERLLHEVRNCLTLPAEGRGTIGDWPPEPSVCVFDLPFAEACRLAGKYGQTAFVVVDEGGLPWLVTRAP